MKPLLSQTSLDPLTKLVLYIFVPQLYHQTAVLKGNIFSIFLIEMDSSAPVLDGFEPTVQITFTLEICSIAISDVI